MQQNNFDFKKYIVVFFITIFIFLSAIYFSNYLSRKKLNQVRDIQNQIAIDILSSETQFSLLSEISCKNISDSFLASELDELGRKLEWSEKNLSNEDEILYLRKYYALLQIKDFLLMKKMQSRCGGEYAFALYFYTKKEFCSLCESQSIVLGKLKEEYPGLRIYSFDYSTDLSAVRSMLQIYGIEDTKLPASVLDDEILTGFQDIETLREKVSKSFNLVSEENLPKEE